MKTDEINGFGQQPIRPYYFKWPIFFGLLSALLLKTVKIPAEYEYGLKIFTVICHFIYNWDNVGNKVTEASARR